MVDAWATAAEVLALTGQVVTDAQILQAQDIIELFSGTTFLATDNIGPTNLRRLNRAVAYQSVWAKLHPDIYTAVDVDTVSQEGASYTPGHENAALLAPLADRHLRRLTWRQRPLRVRRRYGQSDYETSQLGPRDSAANDDNRIWTPM